MNSMRELRDAIRAKLDEQIASKTASIATGSLTDHAAYKNATGRIAGLKDARETVDEVFKKLLNEDDDD